MTKINRTLRNALIFLTLFIIFFGVDLLLKTFIFDFNAKGSDEKSYTVIGTRSLPHYSTTFLDFLNISIPLWVNITVSLIIGFGIIIMIIMAKSKIAVFGLSLMLSGLLGNTIDNIFLGYVRDVLYTPWMDRGTFNFADLSLIIGLPFALIPIVVGVYKGDD